MGENQIRGQDDGEEKGKGQIRNAYVKLIILYPAKMQGLQGQGGIEAEADRE